MTDRNDRSLERLVFFSDAIFAIGITLLVLEVHVPEVAHGAADREYWAALLRLSPNLVGFLVSFCVVGAFWMGHHRAFALAARYSPRVVGWNLALLGTIAFMPFVTAFMADYAGTRVPASIYWGWMVLTALLNLRVNTMAVGPEMRAPDTSDADAHYIRVRGISTVIASVVALAIAQFAPFFGPVGMATIPLWRLLLGRKRPTPPVPAPAA